MMSGRTSEKPATITPARTHKIIEGLKQISDGLSGATITKKPAPKTIRKLKKLLSSIETGHMPWPDIVTIPNGSVMLTWVSLLRDILITIDTDGDAQFNTSLKKFDNTGELTDRLNSEGAITDLKTIDYMMAWFCTDKSFMA